MKILHLDIETSPNIVYAWGLFKQNISLSQIVQAGSTMCWAAKWHGKPKVYFDSEFQSTEEDMIKAIHALIDEADAVCHYNGTKFDMPTLNKEFLKFGLKPPSPYHNIDLLHVAKKQFRLASNKLDYVSQYLGVGSKTKHMGMELWTRCIDGDEKAWKIMEKYNKQDVRLLEKVYNKLLPWIHNHPNHALYKDTDRPVCATCGSKHLQSRGYRKTKTQIYRQFQCQDCGSWMRSRFTEVPADKRTNILNRS